MDITFGERTVKLGTGYCAHLRVSDRFLVQLRRFRNERTVTVAVFDADTNCFVSSEAVYTTAFGEVDGAAGGYFAHFVQAVDVEALLSALAEMSDDGFHFDHEDYGWPKANGDHIPGLAANLPKAADRFDRIRNRMIALCDSNS